MNKIDLEGRIAVVTGGTRGIGYAIAERFAASGAKLALWDLDGAENSARTLTGAGFAVDVSDEKSVTAARDATLARFDKIDILVNSAGITGPNATVEDYPVEAWRQVIDVNLNGTFFCCRAVLPSMRGQDYGRIVNIASVAGKEGNPNAGAYSTSKAGVIALTKSLGKELVQTGIRVNCVTPAAVHTTLFDQMTPQHIEFMLSKIPMGRFGKVEEIAAMVAWLASEECSFSTGAAFDISGGRATY